MLVCSYCHFEQFMHKPGSSKQHIMKQSWQTLVFAAINIFKLGFFKLNPSSKEHYFGLRFIKNRPGKVVKNPIHGLFGVLILALSSKFKITSSAGELPLLSSHHRRKDSNPSASLLPSANLLPGEVNPNETAACDSRQLIECCNMVSTPREEVDSNNNTNADDVGGNGTPCSSEGKYFELKIGLLDSSHLTPHSFCDPSMSHTDCEGMCRANCSCAVYATPYDDDTGCVYWVGKLDFIERNSGDKYYILNSSNRSDNSNNTEGHGPSPAPAPTQPPNTPDPDGTSPEHGKESNITRWWWVWFLVAILAVFLHRSLHHLRAKSLEAPKGQDDFQKENASKEMSSLEMGTWIKSSHRYISADKLEKGEKLGDFYSFSYASILAATNNFSPTNKLGEGGFGPVYKGIVHNGQEIAVKKLSTRSSQGLVEFKNEIMLIAKLQHTNLVRLLGFCMQGKEKLLVYEFMSNNSLDSFLFDPTKRKILNWKKRRVIIEGIAQGLLYLHKYSRLKVIHRDLKASNILLDNDMNPKISDFGIARMFDRNESEASTNRIVGTYGYMSPEYAMEGIFSEKSDVFSFGVILAEIISGKRNTGFSNMDCPLNLIGYAWGLWNEGKSSELIDQTMSDSCSRNELQRCIQVALLCVQDSPTDRPTMSDVVSLLTNENMPPPTPNKPAYCFGRSERELDFNKHKSENCSLNFVTISTLEAR